MAWPKGKSRARVIEEKTNARQTPQDASGSTIAAGLDVDIASIRRRICAHYVRLETIPRDIRIHNYLPLSRIAAVIRRQMAKDGAPDSEVEVYVARHVR